MKINIKVTKGEEIMIEGRKEEKALHWNEKDNKYRIKSAKLQNCKDNSPTVKSKYNYIFLCQWQQIFFIYHR